MTPSQPSNLPTQPKAHPNPDDLAQNLRESGLIHRLLTIAHDEDLDPTSSNNPHDWTGELMFDPTQTTTATLVARQQGIIAGLAFIPDILQTFLSSNESVTWTPSIQDASPITQGTHLGTLAGNARAIVRIERTILNLISRLAGIATRTDHFITLASTDNPNPTPAICDTRKTTPGLRAFEKYAVVCGGGTSHRMGLYDALLVKDNHLHGLSKPDFTKRLTHASTLARNNNLAFVQVEVDTLEQLDWILELPSGTIDMVLLDNMTTDQLTRAVLTRDQNNPSLKLEASGGINEKTIQSIANTGIDRISIGGLTHQAVSLDIGLDIDPKI